MSTLVLNWLVVNVFSAIFLHLGVAIRCHKFPYLAISLSMPKSLSVSLSPKSFLGIFQIIWMKIIPCTDLLIENIKYQVCQPNTRYTIPNAKKNPPEYLNYSWRTQFPIFHPTQSNPLIALAGSAGALGLAALEREQLRQAKTDLKPWRNLN